MNKFWQYFIVFSALALAIGGAFGAWVFREPVAQQLTAPGLAEFVKFLPEKRLGLLPIQRLHFLLPAMVAALSLPLLAVNHRLALPHAANWLLRLAVIPIALATLSPVWAPAVLLNAEFRLQTLIAGIAIGLAVIAPLLRRLSLKWLTSAVAIAAIAATILALRQFGLVNESVAATYASAIGLGWGGWLTVVGAIGLAASAIWLWVDSFAQKSS